MKMKKWIPVILCGSLLIGSVMALAASDDQTPPSLSSVYNLAVKNELSPQEVALAYVHTLVAQRKMELTKAHIDFVKQQAKAASSGLFHHNDEEAQEAVQGSLDLTQADYFAAQAEYQANLNYLNQLVGKAYSQVQELKNDSAVASLDPRLEERYGHMADAAQQLRSAEAAYSVGHGSAQELIQTEQQLYTAQQNYWDDVQIYLTSHIKAEGAPTLIADLQEGSVKSTQNRWAMADAQDTTSSATRVAELASDVRRPAALATLKAVKAPSPIVVARLAAQVKPQVKQVELAAKSVAALTPRPPVVQAPTLPVLPKPEPSVNSAALVAPTPKVLVTKETVKPAVKAPVENKVAEARLQPKKIAKKPAENKVQKHLVKHIAATKTLVENKPIQTRKKLSVAKAALKPEKLATKATTKKPVVASLVKAQQLASLEIFHDYILPAPTKTTAQVSQIDLPAPQSTKFEYV